MLSWNEIRHRSVKFSREWKGTTSEKSERQTFWNEFFKIFGIKRCAVSSFEEPVKKLSGNWGYIDLFWPGRDSPAFCDSSSLETMVLCRPPRFLLEKVTLSSSLPG